MGAVALQAGAFASRLFPRIRNANLEIGDGREWSVRLVAYGSPDSAIRGVERHVQSGAHFDHVVDDGPLVRVREA